MIAFNIINQFMFYILYCAKITYAMQISNLKHHLRTINFKKMLTSI